MKTITIGRIGCDIVIPDGSVSRHHATISLVNGQYVFTYMSKNGSTINGQIIHNDKMVVAPGAAIYLANKVPLPWAQILMLLPQQSVRVDHQGSAQTIIDSPAYLTPKEEGINAFAGIISFLIPIIGVILYFVWKDDANKKAKQALNLAGIGFAINIIMMWISRL